MRRNIQGEDQKSHSIQAGFTKRVECDFTEWNCHTPVNFAAYGVDVYNNSEWYRSGHQKHRAVFNAIYELPGQVVLSGLYFYGDNGWSTTESGVDIYDVGGVIAARTRADGSIIPLNNFNKKDLHRVDLRLTKRLSFGERYSVEPMLEVFNLFNRAKFTDWVLDESSPLFGRPDAADGIAYQPRVIQIGFRARF